ncbi:rhodanese-related sulfurtransferase [Actinobacillus pleuropneumoniae]|uniref:Rhodanese-related sulfurtransferase n=1 Tax=Actinobacillus pleuropneumoniae serovar 6 str. Femo TaxID=754256 RepID=A0A828PXV0_ACTPL|nr:rhodanese-like domain-containing protein [Actinobacillus pleuropneumoniae]EFL80781.1 rhodanese-related sulfurtransferase [Actinobacillus pleuropneumoniae serovar 6 str. Femo]EFM91582.1 Rhodanese-related sulfurtransferase [Actinobacillus pleuropneumoniae serovar 6 str. Femo]UKH11717.1 rhodanese-like domain-containing protein [Actinobacillus pleuropneumoniae serovar 6 str. Femo]SUU66154.1 rhodanese-related sulfurtransferase [Actinobacillus pleuropneumoniae]
MNKLTYLLGALVLAIPVLTQAAEMKETEQTMQNAPLKAKGIWIDVRTADEFQQGHLDGSINIPFEQIADHISKVSPNKDEPVHLYCRSGRRAETALQTLKQLGYNNVTNHGGYQELIEKGYK